MAGYVNFSNAYLGTYYVCNESSINHVNKHLIITFFFSGSIKKVLMLLKINSNIRLSVRVEICIMQHQIKVGAFFVKYLLHKTETSKNAMFEPSKKTH